MRERLGPCCLRWTSGATNRCNILACRSKVLQCVPLTALGMQCCMSRLLWHVVSPAARVAWEQPCKFLPEHSKY